MAKTPAEPYYPGNVPDNLPALITFLYDELWRISRALTEFPVGMNVAQQASGVPVSTVPQEFRLFENELGNPVLDLPGGGWDNVTGEWTVPLNGLFQINVNSVVQPFGGGNKDYAAILHMYVNDVELWSNTDVGDDAYPLSCALSISGFLKHLDVVRWTIELVHDQFVGTTQVTSFASLTSTAQE
jgi:hypothetical protein